MKNYDAAKIVCVTTIGAMGLVPGMFYIHHIPEQPEFNHQVIISESPTKEGDNLHKVLIPPVLFFDATGTSSST